MFDILVNPKTGDIAYDNGEVTLITSYKKIVRQQLEITLKTFVGEWFNNITFGGINKDYFGDPRVTKLEVDAFYRTIILSNPDVIEIIEFESSLNPFTRHYDLDFTVRTLDGPVEVTITSADLEETYTQPDSDIYLPPTTPAIKSAAAFLTGTSSISALLGAAAIPIVAPAINGVSTLTGTAIKILLPITMSHTATLEATMHKAVAATLNHTGILSANATKVLSANLSGGTSSLQGTLAKTNTPTVGGTSGLTATFVKISSATLTGTSNLSGDTGLTTSLNTSGTSSLTGTLVKVGSASLSGTGSVTGTLSRNTDATLSGTSSITASMTKTANIIMSGDSSISAEMYKSGSNSVTGTSNLTGTMVKVASATISGGVNTFSAFWSYGVDSEISGQSYLFASPTKIKSRGSNVSGSSTLTGNITKIKSGAANLSGGTGGLTATAELISSSWLTLEQNVTIPTSGAGGNLMFNDAGTSLYYNSSEDVMSRRTLSSAYNLSTYSGIINSLTGSSSVDGGDISPSGTQLITTDGGLVRLYDLSTANNIATASNNNPATLIPVTGDFTCTDVKFSPDGRQILAITAIATPNVQGNYQAQFDIWQMTTAHNLNTVNTSGVTTTGTVNDKGYCVAATILSSNRMYIVQINPIDGSSWITECNVFVSGTTFAFLGALRTQNMSSDITGVIRGITHGTDGNLYISDSTNTIYKYSID